MKNIAFVLWALGLAVITATPALSRENGSQHCCKYASGDVDCYIWAEQPALQAEDIVENNTLMFMRSVAPAAVTKRWTTVNATISTDTQQCDAYFCALTSCACNDPGAAGGPCPTTAPNNYLCDTLGLNLKFVSPSIGVNKCVAFQKTNNCVRVDHPVAGYVANDSTCGAPTPTPWPTATPVGGSTATTGGSTLDATVVTGGTTTGEIILTEGTIIGGATIVSGTSTLTSTSTSTNTSTDTSTSVITGTATDTSTDITVSVTPVPNYAFNENYHQCGVSNGFSPASPVSSTFKISDSRSNDAKFLAIANPLLACCVNAASKLSSATDFRGGDIAVNAAPAAPKLDCKDNTTHYLTHSPRYSDFQSLWVGTTNNLPNFLIFKNSQGKRLDGYYDENMVRCNDLGTYGPIPVGIVEPQIKNAQVINVTSGAIAGFQGSFLPSIGATQTLSSQMQALMGPTPTTLGQMRKCPYLLQFAVQTECPTNSNSPYVYKKTVIGASGQANCAVASKVSVRMKFWQPIQIAGGKKMQPIDSLLDPKAAASVDIKSYVKQRRINP